MVHVFSLSNTFKQWCFIIKLKVIIIVELVTLKSVTFVEKHSCHYIIHRKKTRKNYTALQKWEWRASFRFKMTSKILLRMCCTNQTVIFL